MSSGTPDESLIKRPPDFPPGFRPSAAGSGLIVPDAVSREEERIAEDDWKHYVRAVRWGQVIGLNLPLICTDDRCKAQPICERLDLPDGTLIVRCSHKDRIYKPRVDGPVPLAKAAMLRREARRAENVRRKQARAVAPGVVIALPDDPELAAVVEEAFSPEAHTPAPQAPATKDGGA